VGVSCTGNNCPKKEIEKTILRILGWCAFSHSLDPQRTWVGEDFVMGVRSDSWCKIAQTDFHRRTNFKAERLSNLEVDHKLELGWRHS